MGYSGKGWFMTKLHIVLFRDGRPGHEKQSNGILKALRHYVELDVQEISVSQKGFIGGVFDHFRFILNLPYPGNVTIRPDMLIGTGSHTHIPILTCKRKFGGYAVTCMSPAGHIRNKFDLCFVPMHDRIPVVQNIFETIGPPNIAENKNSHDHSKSLILVGGKDEGSHRWDSNKLLLCIRDLIGSSNDQSWTVSSSPRTPEETDRLLCSLVKQNPEICYVPYHKSEPGWIEKQYSINKTVWVTGDSISMVYEALTAGCSVGIIPVDWKNKDNKFLYSLDYLIENDKVFTLNQYLKETSHHTVNTILNESDRCAIELLKRWWPENLQ